MALPTLDKSWQHTVSQATGGGATNLADCQDTMYKVKNVLKAFGTLPWTCWGSCDGAGGVGSFGNGDLTDRWSATSKLIWAAAGVNHSWIVLAQSGLGSNGSICIDLANANPYYAVIVLSPSAGFGAANGGADGTATARPTASDEIVLVTAANWGVYQSGTFVMRFHAMQSTDGQCTRVVFCYNNLACGLWQFDKVKNPLAAWTVPVLGAVYGASNSEILTYASFNDVATYPKSKIGAGASPNATFYYTSEGYIAGMVGENIVVADDDSGEWPICPIGLASISSTHRGARKGMLFDMYWGPTQLVTGDTYPGDGTRTFAQFGDFVFPWNGSVPVVA